MNYQKAPELQDCFEPSPRLRIDRRTVLRAGGVALAASIFGAGEANTIATDALWHDTQTSLKVFDTKGAKNGEAWLVVPGLGVQSGEGIMNALRPSFQMGQYAGFIKYADTGLEIDAIAESINRAQHQLGFTSINLYLHSMGGAMAPAILSRLDSSVNIGVLGYNCTPWTKQFTNDEKLIDIIAAPLAQGSYATKLASQLVDRFCRPHREDLSLTEKLGVVFSMTNDSSSPKTWLQQIRYLASTTLDDYQVISEHIRSIYLTPHDPASDTVVRVVAAIEAFKADIPGVKSIVRVGSEGHANPRQYPTEYNHALEPFTEPIYDTALTSHPAHHHIKETESLI